MIRLQLPSIADELDRVDPRTRIRFDGPREAKMANLANARQRRAELRVIRGGKSA